MTGSPVQNRSTSGRASRLEELKRPGEWGPRGGRGEGRCGGPRLGEARGGFPSVPHAARGLSRATAAVPAAGIFQSGEWGQGWDAAGAGGGGSPGSRTELRAVHRD